MSVTEPIQIPIEGDPTDFIADAAKVNKELDKMAGNTSKAGGANTDFAKSAKAASISITDLRSAYMIAADAARVAGQVWQATGQEFVNYAEQVKNLSRNIGVSAEETSRLIQVADDVRISYESLGVAMKTAQKQGVDVSIEGIAKLAEKYNSLKPGIERTQFLLKTFGKSGLEMGKLLEKGGAGIREMTAAVDESLVMTNKGIKASDDYQKSLDNLNDSVAAASLSLGKVFVPVGDTVLRMITVNIEGVKEFIDVLTGGQSLKQALTDIGNVIADNPITLFGYTLGSATAETEDLTQATNDNTDAASENAGAIDEQKAAVDQATKNLEAYKSMLNEVSQANQDAADLSQKIADDQRKYEDEHAQAIRDRGAAEVDLMNAKRGGDEEKIAEATDALKEQQKAVQELEAQYMESSQKIIYDLVLQKLAVDGLTDAELKAADELAVKMGIKTQADIDQAAALREQATAIFDGIQAQEDVARQNQDNAEKLKQLEDEKQAAIDGTTTTMIDGANTAAQATGVLIDETDRLIARQGTLAQSARNSAAAFAAIKYPNQSTGKPYKAGSGMTGGKPPDERDTGGAGIAGTPYMIGTGAQPEVFIPSTNGTFIPNADKKMGGTTYNINITNPKREATEDSINKVMRKLSYIGVAA